jgi:hypothetical protein
MAESTTNAPDLPQYSRGCDLSQVPKAADVAPIELKRILGVDSANPFLRALRIEHGLLSPADLPAELVKAVPLGGDALAALLEGRK